MFIVQHLWQSNATLKTHANDMFLYKLLHLLRRKTFANLLNTIATRVPPTPQDSNCAQPPSIQKSVQGAHNMTGLSIG